jgi:hypothetical protein
MIGSIVVRTGLVVRFCLCVFSNVMVSWVCPY